MSSIFAPPIPAFQQAAGIGRGRQKKRKRPTASQNEQQSDEPNSGPHTNVNNRFPGVFSPEELAQRRQAGISDDRPYPFPPPPFPHKDTTLPKKSRDSDRQYEQVDNQSLRVQHISAMSAVLHKCLRNKDWPRARRALSLLLRTEISGQPLDLRDSDYWGVGAEILFRQQPVAGRTWSRKGFEDAKEYYEKLIVRYPHHRASPDSVNAVDFYLALFSLWIYVAQAGRESWDPERDDPPTHDAVGRELDEAGVIMARIHHCMSTAPYADNQDFQQLQRDVNLWHQNLEREYRAYSPVLQAGLPGEDNLNTGGAATFPT